MRWSSRIGWLVALGLGIMVGCGDDAPKHETPDLLDTSSGDVLAPSTHDAEDTGPEDLTAPDVTLVPDSADGTDGDTQDSGETATPPCVFPAPVFPVAAQARTIIDAPARCGQPAHTWLENTALGDIVSQERKLDIGTSVLTVMLASEGYEPPRPLVYNVAVDQITYVTQDRGQLIDATGLIAYPSNAPADATLDVLLFLHGSVGTNDACAPSNEAVGQAAVALFASMGYLVVMPDYIGLKGAGDPTGFVHPLLVGVPTAIASLDAVRALGKLPTADRGDICAQPRIAVVGGSQGGHAAFWVDRLAPYYAPELELVGVVSTVPPSDLLSQITAALQTLRESTYNSATFLAAAPEWYGYGDRLDEVFLAPYDTDIPNRVANSCAISSMLGSATTLEEVFQPAILSAASAETFDALDPWGCITAENGLTTTSIPRLGPSSPSYAILSVTGDADTLVDTPIERTAMATLCDQGLPIVYLECAGADHIETTLWSLPETIDFIEARFAGETVDPASLCQIGAAVTCQGTP